MQFIPKALAQSVPENGKAVQRTIIDESTIEEPVTISQEEANANSTVLFGLSVIMLVIIVAAAIGLLWSRNQKIRPGKN